MIAKPSASKDLKKNPKVDPKVDPKVLVIDVGGTHVKLLMTGQKEPTKFVSGPSMTAARAVRDIKLAVKGWKFDCISIGYPGPIINSHPLREPHNLGSGWMGMDFAKALGHPVKVINDAAMQALGSYKGGKMLFLGLGTGLGSALIVDGIVEPMELGHLPYKKFTFEDYVGLRGLQKYGKQNWRCAVTDMVRRLAAAIEPDEVVLGGGNVNKLVELPPGCRVGNNTNAFIGGFRLWEKSLVKTNFTKSVAWFGALGCVAAHTGKIVHSNQALGRSAHSFRTT